MSPVYERIVDRERVTQSCFDTASEEGEARGRLEEKFAIAKQMLSQSDLDVYAIAKITGLKSDEVKKLKSES